MPKVPLSIRFIRVWECLDQLREIRDERQGVEPDDLGTWLMVERCLEIISEGSRHVPTDLKETHPELDWQRIADLGNRLRHAYQDIEFKVLWRIVLYDIDALEAAIAPLKDHE